VDELQADEMAKTFRQRVAQAEAAARAEELRLQQEVFGVSTILITFATMMLFVIIPFTGWDLCDFVEQNL
jgi:hypothetical protein